MSMKDEEYDTLARSGCFVCRIIEGRPLMANPRVIYEDSQVIAFLNQLPTQVGYCLVCPKRHVERFEAEMSLEEWNHLMGVVKRVSKAVSHIVDADRMYIASLGSSERNAHVHMHVCPCPKGTPFEGQQFEAMREWIDVDDGTMERIAGEIRDYLQKGVDLEIK